ncbi:MAG: hypothetical protein ACI8WT_004585 [Clostridium sp.]|jgi:hypothetical protein
MQYWLITANPGSKTRNGWNWTNTKKVGDVEKWVAETKNGGKKVNYDNVERFDKVVCYSSGKDKKIVALAEITNGRHYSIEDEIKVIDIKKTEDVKTPLSYYDMKENEVFDRLCSKGIMQSTITKIYENEYDEIIKLTR